jgi:hypothetical protein
MFEVPGEMRVAVLRQLIRAIERGEGDQLAEVGVSHTDQALLSALTVRQVSDLAQMPYLQFRVVCDFSRLSFAIETLRDVHERQIKADYFIAHGASLAQLQDLFGLSRDEVRARRTVLRANHGRGRPALPPHEIREQIAAAWGAMVNARGDAAVSGPEREEASRYLCLHKQFPDVSIAALEAIVRSIAHGVAARCG